MVATTVTATERTIASQAQAAPRSPVCLIRRRAMIAMITPTGPQKSAAGSEAIASRLIPREASRDS